MRVEDDGQPARRRLACPEQPEGALGRVARGFVDVEIGEGATDRVARSGLGVGVVARHREGRARAHRAPSRHFDAERVRDRTLDRSVAVARGPQREDPIVESLRRGFELDRERDLVGSRYAEQLLVPEVELGWIDPDELVGADEAVALVRSTERGVVARVGERVRDDLGIERPGPRVPLAVIDDHADTDAFDLGGRERFDLTFERVHVDVT